MLIKFAIKFFTSFITFILMLLLGVVSFNAYNIKEKLQMLHVANEFHNAQINNDKKLIDNLLTDNFTESGEKRFVQTPDVIYKSHIMKADYPKANVKIEVKYPLILNMFSNSNTSLSFVRELAFLPEDGRTLPSVFYYVTYTFEKTVDGLKINKIVRKF